MILGTDYAFDMEAAKNPVTEGEGIIASLAKYDEEAGKLYATQGSTVVECYTGSVDAGTIAKVKDENGNDTESDDRMDVPDHTSSLLSYAISGPNNELYLTGSDYVFATALKNETANATIQIGMKAVEGTINVQHLSKDVTEDGKYVWKSLTDASAISTAIEMYYKVNLNDLKVVDEKKVLVLRAKSADNNEYILSMTNIKYNGVTFEKPEASALVDTTTGVTTENNQVAGTFEILTQSTGNRTVVTFSAPAGVENFAIASKGAVTLDDNHVAKEEASSTILEYDLGKRENTTWADGITGKVNECLYDLGFDASKEFHTYGFYWGEGVITWYVDGNAVYTATKDISVTPGHIMMNVWSGTGVDDWLQPFNGRTPLTAYYDWMAYDEPEKNGNQNQGGSTTEPAAGPCDEITFQDNQLYTILSKNSGKSVDVYYGYADNGTNVLQYTYNGYDNQKWYIQKQANGYYIIKSYSTGKVLSVEDSSTANGGNVHQWEYAGNPNQEWSLVYTDGYYKLINRNSGLLLDVSDVSKEDNANIHQWEDVGQDNQLWYIAALDEADDSALPFTDVADTAWYYDSVKGVYELGLMTGMDSTTFAPGNPMTRAMAATVLYRMAGNPDVTFEEKFPDVEDGHYYSAPVTWATENGIVNGYTDGKFRPNGNITREQLVKMLYCYGEMLGLDTSARADLTTYTDAAQISNYAKEPMSWAIANGIVSGTGNGQLKAKNNATRAEVAKMLLNFYHLIEK